MKFSLQRTFPFHKKGTVNSSKPTAADSTLKALSTVLRNAWPCHKQELPLAVCEYWSCRDEISEIDGLLFKAQKLIIPQSNRKEMLELIQGIVKCKQRARDILFWPGMSSQIEEKVSQCSLCAQVQRAQPRELMIIQDLPDRMRSRVGTDLFEYNGVHYLLCVDYYSKWIEFAKLDNLTSGNIICHLKSQFARYGIPDELISDNGPQYASSAFTMVLSIPPQVLTSLKQMVKLKGQSDHQESPQESTKSLQGITELSKHFFGWYKPFTCSTPHGSNIEIFPTNKG